MKNILINCLKKLSIFDVIVCFILGITFTVYPKYYTYGVCSINKNMIFNALYLFLIFLILNIILKILIEKINSKSLKVKLFNSKYRLLIFTTFILIVWLPILISLYPGTLSNDTWGQLKQYINLSSGETLSDHHPIFTTLIIGFFITTFKSITNNWHLAFFAYVFIQAMVTSLAFSFSLIYAKEKLKLNDLIILIFLFIYALLPIFPASAQMINKDALFAWIYVLFFISFIEIIRTNGECLDNKKYFVYTCLLIIFCALTKKIGIYVIAPSYFILLFAKVSNKKKIVLSLMVLVVLMKLALPVTFKFFDIKKGGEQEKYSLFFQQTARYIKYHQNDVKDSEKIIIEEVIGKSLNEIKEVYNPIFADPVKGYTQNTTKLNYYKYLKVWAMQGLRHPKTYIDAANSMFSGWISFNMYKPLMNMDWHSQLSKDIFNEKVAERGKTKNSAIFISNTYDNLYKVPVLKYVLTPGMYIALIPMFSVSVIIKSKNKKYLLALIPLFLSIVLGCFLAPDSRNGEGQRYLYPVTYTSIVTLMLTTYAYKKK